MRKNRPLKTTVCLLAMSALAASVAGAATVNLLLDPNNLAANGWSTTIKHSTPSYVYTPGGGAITQVADYGGVGAFKFTVPAMNTAWTFDFASIGTGNLAGTPIQNITSIKMRVLGITGDNAASWQPPSITLSLQKGTANSDRNLVYVPWSTQADKYGVPAAHPRASGQWFTFDATTEGTWVVADTGTKYSTWAAAASALSAQGYKIASSTYLPLDWGYASQQGVNVGMYPLYDEQRSLDSAVSGEVDWFEFTVAGVTTRYDLGVVPEPSSLALLAVGLGLVAIRRRK